jgi:alpha-aminoadipate carrier protein LysW
VSNRLADAAASSQKETRRNETGSREVRRTKAMFQCTECNANIDVEMDEVDEGDILSCDECGAVLRVVSVDPPEVELEEDADDFEDDDDEEEESW